MTGILEKDIEIEGENLHYLESGKGDPLILLHPVTVTAKTQWTNHLPLLANHFRVLAPDLRGHGGSSNNSHGPMKPQDLMQDIIAFVQALNIEKPLICGWSFGGQIALEIGIQFPTIPNALISGGVMYAPTEGYISTLKSWGINGQGDVDFEVFMTNFPNAAPFLEKIHSDWKELFMQLSKMWYAPDNFVFPGQKVKTILNPVLLILGDRDSIINVEHAVQMFRMIPNSQLAIFPNRDHDLPNYSVKMLCDTILTFWKQIKH
ncbi:MAG: alpha/beta fold hydrolase [Candidatus Hodarchaeota archaeon]